MRKRKSVCGLCKPTKKWKQNNTRKANNTRQLLKDEFTATIKLRILKR